MTGFVLQNGWSPLHVASQNGHLDVVKTLIAAGTNMDQAKEVRILKCNTFTQSTRVCHHA